jgi:hypothetical protein
LSMPMPMSMPPQGGELVEFETEGEENWTTLKLKDGSVLKFRSVVTAIFRIGNDPNTGLPVYAVQNSNAIRVVSIPKELIKKEKEKDKKELPPELTPAPVEPHVALALSDAEFQELMAGLELDPAGEWAWQYAAPGPVTVEEYQTETA